MSDQEQQAKKPRQAGDAGQQQRADEVKSECMRPDRVRGLAGSRDTSVARQSTMPMPNVTHGFMAGKMSSNRTSKQRAQMRKPPP